MSGGIDGIGGIGCIIATTTYSDGNASSGGDA